MALTIHHAILHVLNGTEPQFSREELDIDSETCYEFISKHVRRLMNNPAAKEAVFAADSPVYELVQNYQKGDIFFHELSVKLCERLSAIMEKGPDIPAADILVAAFESGHRQFLAVLKLNYIECFTHRIARDENVNHIIKNTAVLPAAGGKVEEACLIPYDPMILRILEKPYAVDGQETDYFSQLFLGCETEMSKKETADLLREIAGEIGAKHFDDDPEVAARLNCAFIGEAEESDEEESFRLENALRRVFAENEQVREDFLALAKDAGLPHEVKLDKGFVKRQFQTQTFKADNGIEIKCPSELFGDPETVQLAQNSDGSVTITLKNLRRAQ